jgi:hypothetical protein
LYAGRRISQQAFGDAADLPLFAAIIKRVGGVAKGGDEPAPEPAVAEHDDGTQHLAGMKTPRKRKRKGAVEIEELTEPAADEPAEPVTLN